ncbi:hypothetical protein [Cellvibrio japonicus]|uniref:hypothetical protein n=1 Tax=Cellvibrio japonicus TaxID=155077 RepID=UPI0005A0C804|nr:hypothetical protein [Cellvibrio japonicus]QEI10976.1 hypothetical protein FY117_01195 [Cellvibrio japonicus]QEI14552.1 hypothetical protein FY116_01195 [Cellvibrio japonicus]QEI18130.1 hypothetical protein FY115_01195 [Cellvibrio japonicus]
MQYLQKFITESHREFQALADTVWKLNCSIDDLYEEEKAKLAAYFPSNKELQALRWRHEGYILEQVIPKALNYSLIVFVHIELETRLMKLCNYLHESEKLPIKAKELNGQGVTKYLKYIESFFGANINKIDEIEDILSLGQIRNCIVHTNGFVNLSSNSAALNKIINQGKYLTKDKIDLRSGEQALIKLETTDDGERLKIDFHYPFILCGYASRFLESLVRSLKK